MEYATIPGVAKPVSRLIQGTMMFHRMEEAAIFDLLDGVYASGCTTFDTAHAYYDGACEGPLGRWIAARGLRDKVVIVGKGAHPYDGRHRVTPEDIAVDFAESCERLGMDFIDLYLLHRDDPIQPVGDIVDCLNDYQVAGRISAFGVSNWHVTRIAEANAYAEARGLSPFVASSPQFSLAEQVKEPWPDCVSIGGEGGREERAWYEATGLPVLCWSSLAAGWLSGRLDLADLRPRRRERAVRCYKSAENIALLERLQRIAHETGYTVAQLALAFVLHHPMNTFAVVGCESSSEFTEDAKAFEVDADLACMDQI